MNTTIYESRKVNQKETRIRFPSCKVPLIFLMMKNIKKTSLKYRENFIRMCCDIVL